MDDSGTVILGVVGSTAYGLDNPDSDIDRLGVWVRDTNDFLGLAPPGPESGQNTRVQHEPSDIVMHELGKFCTLALKVNPTITELLWLTEYDHLDPIVGEWLVEHRTAFLSSGYVRNAYLGYASQQFQRLLRRGDGSFSSDTRRRKAKHGRHLMRLLDQGRHLWATGSLVVRVTEPERHIEFGQRLEGGNLDLAAAELAKAEEFFDQTPTVLSPMPNRDKIEDFVVTVRKRQVYEAA